MTQRRAWAKVAPDLYRQMSALDQHISAHLEPSLYELVKLRAPMINGYAFCIDMHSTPASARAAARATAATSAG